MYRKIIQYEIVQGDSTNIAARVNDAIRQNHLEPFGNLILRYHTDEHNIQHEQWFQPMVGYEDVISTD